MTIPLPHPTGNSTSLFDAIAARRTTRDFAAAALEPTALLAIGARAG